MPEQGGRFAFRGYGVDGSAADCYCTGARADRRRRGRIGGLRGGVQVRAGKSDGAVQADSDARGSAAYRRECGPVALSSSLVPVNLRSTTYGLPVLHNPGPLSGRESCRHDVIPPRLRSKPGDPTTTLMNPIHRTRSPPWSLSPVQRQTRHKSISSWANVISGTTGEGKRPCASQRRGSCSPSSKGRYGPQSRRMGRRRRWRKGSEEGGKEGE